MFYKDATPTPGSTKTKSKFPKVTLYDTFNPFRTPGPLKTKRVSMKRFLAGENDSIAHALNNFYLRKDSLCTCGIKAPQHTIGYHEALSRT